MKIMSVERKLELAKSLREDQVRNMGLIKRRENLVWEEVPTKEREQVQSSGEVSSLKIRFFLAILLGAAFFYMQNNSSMVYGIDTQAITAQIRAKGILENMIFEIEEMVHMWYNGEDL